MVTTGFAGLDGPSTGFVIVTVLVVLAASPEADSTESVIVFAPSAGYSKDAVGLSRVQVPSPSKSHANRLMLPSGSREPDASTVT